jgi:hypothetical protein
MTARPTDRQPQRAAQIAQVLCETPDLMGLPYEYVGQTILHMWPDATHTEIERAWNIAVELKAADFAERDAS